MEQDDYEVAVPEHYLVFDAAFNIIDRTFALEDGIAVLSDRAEELGVETNFATLDTTPTTHICIAAQGETRFGAVVKCYEHTFIIRGKQDPEEGQDEQD